MHDDNKVTREQIEVKIEELVELFKQYNEDEQNCDCGSLSSMAEYAIGQIVIMACTNHYEGIGIFEEALQSFRETSLESMNEDNDDRCADCGEPINE